MKLDHAVRGYSTIRICGDFRFCRMIRSLVGCWLQRLGIEDKQNS